MLELRPIRVREADKLFKDDNVREAWPAGRLDPRMAAGLLPSHSFIAPTSGGTCSNDRHPDNLTIRHNDL